MNECNHPALSNRYASPALEPSWDRMAAAVARPPNSFSANQRTNTGDRAYRVRSQSMSPSSPPVYSKRRTLKHRIKRNMMAGISNSLTSSVTSAASAASATSPFLGATSPSSQNVATKDPREDSVLAAASALASLGVTSPASSFNSSHGRGLPALLGVSPTSSFVSLGRGETRKREAEQQLSSSIRPPPIVAPTSADISKAASSHEILRMGSSGNDKMLLNSTVRREFAPLIGSDIPLTFPQKLMEILSNSDITDIITWLPHGKGFIILQKRKFALDVMPLYFKHSKYTSFTRKLNRWGFNRVSRGPEMGAYYHKYFQRGDYLLCMQMHCQSNNKSSKTPIVTTNTTDVANANPSSPAASPKPSPKPSPKTPPISSPPSLNASPHVAAAKKDTAMPPLALDVELSSVALSVPRNATVSNSAPLPNTNPKPGYSSTISNDNDEIMRHIRTVSSFVAKQSNTREEEQTSRGGGGGTLARFGNDHDKEQAQQKQQQQAFGSTNAGDSLDRAFRPQQESFRGAQSITTSSSKPTFFQHGNSAHQGQRGSSMMTSSSLPLQHHQHVQRGGGLVPQPPSLHQQQQQYCSSNIDQAIAVQKLLGVDTSSSRSHPLVIENAMKALKACNAEHALLKALVSKNQDPSSQTKGSNRNILTPPQQQANSYQAEGRVRAAMLRAQIRQLEEECREEHQNRSNLPGVSQGSGRSGASGRIAENTAQTSTATHERHAKILEQMRQLDDLNQRRVMAGMNKLNPQFNISTMSQRSVAQLCNQITAARQQQRQHEPESASNNRDARVASRREGKFPQGVRRASAA